MTRKKSHTQINTLTNSPAQLSHSHSPASQQIKPHAYLVPGTHNRIRLINFLVTYTSKNYIYATPSKTRTTAFLIGLTPRQAHSRKRPAKYHLTIERQVASCMRAFPQRPCRPSRKQLDKTAPLFFGANTSLARLASNSTGPCSFLRGICKTHKKSEIKRRPGQESEFDFFDVGWRHFEGVA